MAFHHCGQKEDGDGGDQTLCHFFGGSPSPIHFAILIFYFSRKASHTAIRQKAALWLQTHALFFRHNPYL